MSELRAELEQSRKTISELQSGGARPGIQKPRAIEAADEVSAKEAASASKSVAQRLIIGLAECDMKATSSYLPRTHISPLHTCRTDDDKKVILEMLCSSVSKSRQEQQRQPVHEIPMSFTRTTVSKVGSHSEQKKAKESLFAIFLRKRREAKMDCGQKAITAAVKAEREKFKVGTEKFPCSTDGAKPECGIFREGWGEAFDKVFG